MCKLNVTHIYDIAINIVNIFGQEEEHDDELEQQGIGDTNVGRGRDGMRPEGRGKVCRVPRRKSRTLVVTLRGGGCEEIRPEIGSRHGMLLKFTSTCGPCRALPVVGHSGLALASFHRAHGLWG